MDNSGSAVLVTGGSTGFGRLTAETLTRQGHRVFASMRDTGGRNASHAAELEDLAERDGLALEVVEIDTSDEASVERGVAEVFEKAGRIDVLVNNVGQGAFGIAEGYALEQVEALFETNVFSAVRMNRAVIPHMREQRSGLIVQVSAMVGRFVMPFMGNYSAAKHAVDALTEAYRYELAPFGIDAVIVEPGTGYATVGATRKLVEPKEQERVAGYGELAERARGIFEQDTRLMDSPEAPKPQDVADAIARLIHTPPGQRPLRTPVGDDARQVLGPINAATEQVQAQTIGYMGLGDLLSPAGDPPRA